MHLMFLDPLHLFAEEDIKSHTERLIGCRRTSSGYSSSSNSSSPDWPPRSSSSSVSLVERVWWKTFCLRLSSSASLSSSGDSNSSCWAFASSNILWDVLGSRITYWTWIELVTQAVNWMFHIWHEHTSLFSSSPSDLLDFLRFPGRETFPYFSWTSSSFSCICKGSCLAFPDDFTARGMI